MKKLTAGAFRILTSTDPSWAATLSEEIEVTECCNLAHSPITHLSPLLRFTGRDDEGNVANFSHCPNLKVAEGVFHGAVNFASSGIERIGNLTIARTNIHKTAATFDTCKDLKVAEGTFPGWVSFAKSGIERIGELTITEADGHGCAASFENCAKLKIARGTFPGFVTFSDSGVEKIEGLIITQPDTLRVAANFHNCKHLKVAEGTFPGSVSFLNAGIERIGKFSAESDNHLYKADFHMCHKLILPKQFLGDDYAMEPAMRQKNLIRIAAGKAVAHTQRKAPEIEI